MLKKETPPVGRCHPPGIPLEALANSRLEVPLGSRRPQTRLIPLRVPEKKGLDRRTGGRITKSSYKGSVFSFQECTLTRIY
ncbi:hypothetical protein evm_007740 [Chilo suppressalis]|nr:hypothetical protein evm_007740 [Chilo suppressalis]